MIETPRVNVCKCAESGKLRALAEYGPERWGANELLEKLLDWAFFDSAQEDAHGYGLGQFGLNII